MRRTVLGLVAAGLLTTSCGDSSPVAPTSQNTPAYVAALASEAVNIFQANSFLRNQIDWASVRSQVAAAAAAGKSKSDTMSLLLTLVNDNHSYYRPRGGGIVFPFPTEPCQVSAPTPPVFTPPDDVGYVLIPTDVPGGDSGVLFAKAFQNDIQQRDHAGLSGWIVDIRQNAGGGSIWPMIAGVGPILGEGLAGYFVSASEILTSFGYADGASWQLTAGFGPTFLNTVVSSPYHLLVPSPRVAVLTDSLTNSAGEAMTIAFHGRPNTRSFGGQTCGRSGSDTLFTLSNGDALAVMSSIDVDRNGVRFGGVIVPDETISDFAQLTTRAVQWLRTGQ